MDAAAEEVPVPPQWKPQPIYDFRHMDYGPRGYKINTTKWGNIGTKRKLDEYAEQVEREQAEMETQDPSEVEIGTIKKPKLDTTGVGKVSGRPWKQPSTRASTLKNPGLSTSWEKKMKVKAETQAYRQRKKDAKEAIKQKAKEERQRREEAKRRKEENRKKSEVVQRVSAETARRMMKSKKGRKQLTTSA